MAAGIPFGDYLLQRRIGAGGMAEVFLAKRVGPEGFEKHLVIKRILPHLSTSKDLTSLFLNEARLAARIDHPNLAHVSDFGEVDGTYYIAMEFVPGVTLAALLKSSSSRLSSGAACRIGVDMLEALHAVHVATDDQGKGLQLVHRDVSPANVMVTAEGVVKLLDFGVTAGAGQAPSDWGTRQFMSPEQRQGEKLDARSDLFAAATVICLLASNQFPFEEEAPELPAKPPGMPTELWAILLPALATDPRDRPESARKLQGQLEVYLSFLGAEGTRANLIEQLEASGVTQPIWQGRGPVRRLTAAVGTLVTQAIGDSVWPAVAVGVGACLLAVAVSAVLIWNAGSGPERPNASAGVVLPPETAIDVAPAVPQTDSPDPTAAVTPAEPSRKTKAPTKRERRPAVRTGQLTIDTVPWTEVYLDGRKLGMTPMQRVVLPSGRQELELRNPKLGISRKQTVTIRPGRETRLNLSL